MIILRSILTTFEARWIFEAAEAVTKIGTRLKLNQITLQNLACPNGFKSLRSKILRPTSILDIKADKN